MIFNKGEKPVKIALIGASGGIGGALLQQLLGLKQVEHVYSFSRKPTQQNSARCSWNTIDFFKPDSIREAADSISEKLDLVICATGTLRSGSEGSPERQLKELTLENLEYLMQVNCHGPTLVARHFLEKFDRKQPCAMALFSARVGSISDNRLGGWYSYRMSKAALNMAIKSMAIEYRRKLKGLCLFGYHPGTVLTSLSKDFISRNYQNKVLDPDHAAHHFFETLNGLGPDDSGQIFDWKGERIEP